jgi:hypothetical protein
MPVAVHAITANPHRTGLAAVGKMDRGTQAVANGGKPIPVEECENWIA